MSEGHSHAHVVGHHHHFDQSRSLGPLYKSLGLILVFLLFELVCALLAHSLALLSDAAHMLADAFALGASVWAARLAAKPPSGGWTFGWKRAEILSALVNGLTLLLLGALLLVFAIQRLVNPGSVAGGLVLIVALVGIAVNVAATRVLSAGARESLNVEGSFRHLLTDLYAFIGTVVAGLVIVLTGFVQADAIASLVVVGLMFFAAYGLLRDSGRILLEAAPSELDVDAIAQELVAQPHVTEIHDVHVWMITSGFPAIAAHILVDPNIDCHAVRRDLEELLRKEFDITHTTLQVDHPGNTVISAESLLDPNSRHSNTSVPVSWRRRSTRP